MKRCLYESVPRSVVGAGLTKVILHGFVDASKLAFSAAVYALAIHTSAPVQQNQLVGKSRIAPREQSIPCLELVAARTPSRLMHHVKEVLKDQRVEQYHCWVHGTTVLYRGIPADVIVYIFAHLHRALGTEGNMLDIK